MRNIKNEFNFNAAGLKTTKALDREYTSTTTQQSHLIQSSLTQ